jgi:hypothetical protein
MVPIVDIDIEANNFMALNTTAKDNPLYYGIAYGTGNFSFKGPTNNMRINIDAKTEAGTVFNLPLNSAQKVANNDFITFVSKDPTIAPRKEQSFNGLVMNLNLQVDEASRVNIITDLGVLSGRGKSELISLKITSLGDFEMFGTYFITSGEFQYTAQEYISKIFEIRQGGMIRWSGDPVESEINLKAVYSQRASLSNLYIAAGRPRVDQSVIAEAVMNLSGILTRPTIDLDIDFPQDSYVKDELQNYLSDVNNTNQQALSLIARRAFSANTSLNVNAINQTLFSAVTEVGFNKLNNIIAQTFNLKSVDFNVKSFNEASASLRFFNDRLKFTGGVTDKRSNVNQFEVIGNSIIRDVEASYLIKKDGSLILRASNRLNNRVVLNNSNQGYISAIGLVYQKDFDTLGEFFRALIGKSREEERQPEIPKAPDTPPPTPATTPAPSAMVIPEQENKKGTK